MGQKEEYVSPPANPTPKPPTLCEECAKNSSKYKCPGCSIRSCSLSCVNAHKKRTGCTRKRQLSQIVPMSQFDDNLLLSDYNMLEDLKRVAESAQRKRFKLCGYSHWLPFPLKALRNAASKRRTKLLFLPSGMSKRETNQSYYNTREKFISWTIEWRFHSTAFVVVDHGVQEKSSLSSVIEKHLKPGPWNHPLREYCNEPLDSLKFFIRKYVKGPKSPFCELDINAPMRVQFANLCILEYPVIHVFLPSYDINFEVVKCAIPRGRESKKVDDSVCTSPQGITFREEQIDDVGCAEPIVSDLMKDSSANTTSETLTHLDALETASTAEGVQVQMAMPKNDIHVNTVVDYTSKPMEQPLDENLDFDFDIDQGLIDAYADLIAQTNPDDFLDLESIMNDKTYMGEANNFADISKTVDIDEVEEGEIV